MREPRADPRPVLWAAIAAGQLKQAGFEPGSCGSEASQGPRLVAGR
jgi:hypothetical protein